MLNLLLGLAMVAYLSSCASLPQLFTAADDIFTDNVLTVEVQKEAMKKDADIDISIKVSNKEKEESALYPVAQGTNLPKQPDSKNYSSQL